MSEEYDSTCDVWNDNNGKMLLGSIESFVWHDILIVTILKAIRLRMKWNGVNYEYQMLGTVFNSNGPGLVV